MAREQAINAINTADDFVVSYLNKEGGGTIGAVRSNRRHIIVRVLMETVESMMKKGLPDFLKEMMGEDDE